MGVHGRDVFSSVTAGASFGYPPHPKYKLQPWLAKAIRESNIITTTSASTCSEAVADRAVPQSSGRQFRKLIIMKIIVQFSSVEFSSGQFRQLLCESISDRMNRLRASETPSGSSRLLHTYPLKPSAVQFANKQSNGEFF